MNQSSIVEKWPWLDEAALAIRSQLLDILSDADLAFSPGGQNATLGGLLREMGDIEYQYIESLKTLKHDWSYHNTEAGLESSVAQIKAWYKQLDDELLVTLSALSQEELTKLLDPGGFSSTVERQVGIYREAQLIFFGKVVVYLRAMNKSLPGDFQDYFG